MRTLSASVPCGRLALAAGWMLMLLTAGGCNVLGAVAAKMPEPPVDAAYKGLAAQPTGIWVWTDPTLESEFGALRVQLGQLLQRELVNRADAGMKDVAEIHFPYAPESFVRFQSENPGWEIRGVEQIAGRINRITRLIYVELHDFETRSLIAPELMRGSARAHLRVFEIADGRAREVYNESDIGVVWPPGVREEGSLNLQEPVVRARTMDALAFQLANRFTQHSKDAR